MPALPTYARYWAAKMWADLPEKTTPIIAAALKHWDDWHSMTRDRVEEIAAALAAVDAGKADKATQVIAGAGLSGGGDLGASRTLSVVYGTTSSSATRGDDGRVVNALQKPLAPIAAGDLLVGLAGGGLERLPRTQPGMLLGSGSATPQWVAPGDTGLGMPTAATAGMIPVSLSDGTWTLIPAPTYDKQQLTADLTSGAKVAWADPPGLYTSTLMIPVLDRSAAFSGISSWKGSGSALVQRDAATVTIGSAYAAPSAGGTFPLRNNGDPPYLLFTLPPDMRPAATKTFAVQLGGLNYRTDAPGASPINGGSYQTEGYRLIVSPTGSVTLGCTLPASLERRGLGSIGLSSSSAYDRTT